MTKKLRIALSSFRRESTKSWGYAWRWSTHRIYYRFIKPFFFNKVSADIADQNRVLTVVIPAAEKDASVLVHCLKSARKMIQHRIAEILVVAPESNQLRQITQNAGESFIPEDQFLPRPASDLKCRGWLLQQFIKINAALHVSSQDYLVLDADTVFIKPQTFFCNGRTVLRYSDQYELLYNRALQMIFGHTRRFPVSFITHHMVLNAIKIKKLINHIERLNRQPWYKYIRDAIDTDHNHLISFSEYEIYGNYVVMQPAWRRDFLLEYWYGQESCAENVVQLDQLRKSISKKINTISFHQHTQ